MPSIEEILQNPPEGVDLTLVGGQALIYWTLSYRNRYPHLFPDSVISSTYDIDYVIKTQNDACKKCVAHWGGVLLTPSPDDHTPHVGKIVIDDGDENIIEIDLLHDLFRLNQSEIDKHRLRIEDSYKYKDMYVLSEYGVLLNRIYNVISSPSYRRPESLIQLQNSLAIFKAYITWLSETGCIGDAQSACSKLLKLAKVHKLGITIFIRDKIDLLDALPDDHSKFSPEFMDRAFKVEINQIGLARQRQVDHIKKLADDQR